MAFFCGCILSLSVLEAMLRHEVGNIVSHKKRSMTRKKSCASMRKRTWRSRSNAHCNTFHRPLSAMISATMTGTRRRIQAHSYILLMKESRKSSIFFPPAFFKIIFLSFFNKHKEMSIQAISNSSKRNWVTNSSVKHFWASLLNPLLSRHSLCRLNERGSTTSCNSSSQMKPFFPPPFLISCWDSWAFQMC